MDASVRRETAPWLFLCLTLAYSWVLEGVAAVGGQSWTAFPTVVLFALATLGPLLIAAVLVQRGAYRHAAGIFWRRVVDPRPIAVRWWLAIAAIALLPYLIGRLVGGSDHEGGGTSAAILLIAVAAGIAEEPGWRGYALDGLLRRYPMLTAALIVGAVWAVWHLPLFLIAGTYQHQIGLASGEAVLFFAALVVQAVPYAWVYVGTGGSILAVVALHALQNAAGELVSVAGAEPVELLVLAGFALIVAVGWRRRAVEPSWFATSG